MPAPKRLRPGELDGLVLAYLAEHKGDGPLTATAIGKGIGRSPGRWPTASHAWRRTRGCARPRNGRARTP